MGTINEGPELAPFEEHLLGCAHCAARAEETEQYVTAMREAAKEIRGASHQDDSNSDQSESHTLRIGIVPC